MKVFCKKSVCMGFLKFGYTKLYHLTWWNGAKNFCSLKGVRWTGRQRPLPANVSLTVWTRVFKEPKLGSQSETENGLLFYQKQFFLVQTRNSLYTLKTAVCTWKADFIRKLASFSQILNDALSFRHLNHDVRTENWLQIKPSSLNLQPFIQNLLYENQLSFAFPTERH